MRIGGVGSSTVMPRTAREAEAAPDDTAPSTSRALIPVAAPAPSERTATPTRRPLAPFLAHLIATQTQAPQTRTRRRAEPEEAIGVYGVALARPGRVGGRLARDA